MVLLTSCTEVLYWIKFISGDLSDEKRFTGLDTQTDVNKFHQNIGDAGGQTSQG